jgi:hypothetical protein
LLKKSITYTNFADEEVTEDFFFHLSKAEMVELELSEQGGLSKKLQEIVASNDGNTIIQTFKDLVLKAYGQKSHDGKRFIKTQELRDEFQSTEAYSVLFMELVTNAEAAAEFVNGVVPQGLEADMDKLIEQRREKESVEEATTGNVFRDNPTEPVSTPPPGTPRVLTVAEAHAMDQAELSHLLSTGRAVLGDSSGG